MRPLYGVNYKKIREKNTQSSDFKFCIDFFEPARKVYMNEREKRYYEKHKEQISQKARLKRIKRNLENEAIK